MNSPETALAQAFFDVMEKNSTEKDPNQDYTDALYDILNAFAINCHSKKDRQVAGKVSLFFRVTVGKRILNGTMGWAGDLVCKPFALECVQYLAKKADDLARKANGPVTVDILNAAAKVMIKDRCKDCPLPITVENPHNFTESQAKLFSTACNDLASEIGLQLDALGCPKQDE